MTNDLEKGKSNLPANLMDDIFATAGQGVDYETSELQIPFVRVIQALSPQIKKNDPMFIKGASQGDAFNTVTGDYWVVFNKPSTWSSYQEIKAVGVL